MVFSRRAAEVFLAQSRSAVASVRGDRRETSGLSCALHTPTIHYIYVHVLRTCSRLSHHFLACFFAAAFHGFSRLMLAIARLAQKELYSHAEPQRLLSRRDDTYERMSSLRGLRPFGGENRETFGLCREYEEI